MKDFKGFNDALLKLQDKMPADVREAWIWTNDTLYLAKISAEEQFGDSVSPEVVLAVYDRLAARIAAAKPRDDE